MGDVIPFKRPEGKPPLSAYAKLMMERAIEEIRMTKPIAVPKKDGAA